MEFGICLGLDRMDQIDDLGFDFVEVNASGVAALGDEAFAELMLAYAGYKTPVRASNGFFPATMRLVGEERDLDACRDYIEHTMDRMKMLGVEVMVLGSGTSRRYDEGQTYQEALAEFREVIDLVADAAQRHEIVVVLEPLNRSETNLLNYVAETAALVACVNHPYIGVLADYFHIQKDEEQLEDLYRVAPLSHVHIATLERYFPIDQEDFAPLIDVLSRSGYTGRISIEAITENLQDDAARAIELYRELQAVTES